MNPYSILSDKADCFKSQNFRQGFVLVEVIVVAVIVGILATVAIPVYSSYVKNQRIDTAKNIARSTAASANIYYRRTGSLPICSPVTPPSCESLLNIFLTDPANYRITIQLRTVSVEDLYHPEIGAQAVAF